MRWRGLVAGAAVGPVLFIGVSACGDDESPEAGTLDGGSAAEEGSNGDNGGDQSGDEGEGSSGQDSGGGDSGSSEQDPAAYDTAEEMPEDLLQSEIDAFVGEFFEAVNQAPATGDTSAAREMTTEDCGPCWNPLDSLDEDYAKGHEWRWDGFDDDFTVSIEEVQGNMVETQVSGSFAALEVVDEDGGEVASFDPAEFIYYFGIDRDENGDYTIAQGSDYT